MKLLWVLLVISLASTEQLDRVYLPPPGSKFSGGSPGALDVPLELPNTEYREVDKGFSKKPALVIGLDRVAEDEDVTFGVVSTQKPTIPNIYNSYTSLTQTPFLKLRENHSQDPVHDHAQDHSSNDFDPEIIKNIDMQPNLSSFKDIDKAYLPPNDVNTFNTKNIISNPMALEVGNFGLNKYDEPDSKDEIAVFYKMTSINPNNQQNINLVTSTPSISLLNSNSINDITTKNNNYHSSDVSQLPEITPITLPIAKSSVLNDLITQRTERPLAHADRQAVILNYDQSLTPEGYAYSFDTSNGIHGDEAGTATGGVRAKGSYSYIGDDGILYKVEYTADENGFVPKGAHLPTAPPIPDAILKVIEQAAKNKEAGIYDDGFYDEEKYGYKKYQGRYPQINNMLTETDFLPENENIFVKSDLLSVSPQTHENNGIEKSLQNNENVFTKNLTPQNDVNYDKTITYDMDDPNNISRTDILLNKNDQDQSSRPDFDNFLSHTNNKIPFEATNGYEYFPPQKKIMTLFSSRFSGKNQDKDIEKATTPKPFLTPYVSRIDDDSEIRDDDELFGNEEIYGEEFHQDNPDPVDNQEYNENNPIKSKFSNDSANAFVNADKIQNYNPLEPYDGKKSYNYNNASHSFVTLNPRTSTVSTSEFPFRGISSTNNRHFNSVTDHTSPQIPSSNNNSPFDILSSSTKSPIPSKSTYTISPIVDKSSVIPVTGSISKSALTSTNVKSFKATDQNVDNYLDNSKTSTESIMGEDFTGPKQRQRFDPKNGYHY